MGCPPKILELVERFHENAESYKSGQYNETQLRRDFIDPMFKTLGWDIDNRQGYAETYREVIHEDSIKIGATTKVPDYSFRIGEQRKFFLEAKKPYGSIKDDIDPAFQLRRYGWSAKLPISILTDFEEFAVYDCRVKPNKDDKASTARINFIKFNEYLERWSEIESVFSREAILKGSFDKYVVSNQKKKGTAEVDSSFLTEIETWRDKLARNISLRNKNLSQRDLNYAVQVTIDRLIFLRICEDRGIEGYRQLYRTVNGGNIYEKLLRLFEKADDRYNSGLFHFREEKGRSEGRDELTPNLNIDDPPLKDIIKSLYYPDSPYEFSVLPANILGQVYEQFLGKVIRLTPTGKAVVEDKPEVKKSGGVYYTPTYIVDYIVKNTVGKLLDGKMPRQAGRLKVIDPDCGSGSFLLGAYQFLLDWHLEQYLKDPLKNIKFLHQGRMGEWKLSIKERKRILTNNIYGVDIDAQAVETTKLSLLLKVLENESDQTVNQNLQLFQERALPDLSQNIKCGNSLIGTDYYEGGQIGLLNEEEHYRVNAFDWAKEFPQAFNAGGFDAVIGNPPYVRQESLGKSKSYLENNYKAYHGVADLYVYFIEKGISLLNKSGLFSYIVANKWMRANYGKPLRRWLKEQNIEEIIDFGDLPVFNKVTAYPCILRAAGSGRIGSIKAANVENLEFERLEDALTKNRFTVTAKALKDSGWTLTDKSVQNLLDKLKKVGKPLGEYVGGKIFYGIKTGLNEAFVIDGATKERLIKEDKKSAELIKPFLAGRDIKRYAGLKEERDLILIPKGWTKKKTSKRNPWGWFKNEYPAIASHLEPYSAKAHKRLDKGDFWWELRACDYYEEFEKPKLIIPAIAKTARTTFDNCDFFSNDKTTIIGSSNFFVLGILNSKLSDLTMHKTASTKQGGYFEYKQMYISKIPIYEIDPTNGAEILLRDKIVFLVELTLDLNKKLEVAKTAHCKNVIQRQIDATDREIDILVYKLYGLTEEEIKIVEAHIK